VVKVHALAGEVWEYIDPSKVEVPVLKEPTLPRPEDVNADITSYGRLSAEEKDDYKMLRQDYKLELDRYTRKKSALSSLCNHIQSSVSRSCLFYTYGTITVQEMLIELKKRLQPTDQLRELELSRKYSGLKKNPKNQDIIEWLYTWERYTTNVRRLISPTSNKEEPLGISSAQCHRSHLNLRLSGAERPEGHKRKERPCQIYSRW
jgi:hypothetical protein